MTWKDMTSVVLILNPSEADQQLSRWVGNSKAYVLGCTLLYIGREGRPRRLLDGRTAMEAMTSVKDD